MSATRPTAIPSLGSQLERDRLEYRVTRASLAIVALRRNANAHHRERQARRLRQAIADFEAQVDAMNARLQDLAPTHAQLLAPANPSPRAATNRLMTDTERSTR